MVSLVNQAVSDSELRAAIVTAVGRSAHDLSALDLWVRGHFRYRPEQNEVIRTPSFMWHSWQTEGWFEGDCDDVSVMFATVLRSLGYHLVRFVAIRYNSNNPAFEHVFVEAYDFRSGGWRVFDPTVSPGTNYNAIERMVERV